MQQQSNTHTPGPWHNTGLPAPYEHAISDENGVAIARVFRGPLKNGPYSAGNGNTNAALIAAAPDLLVTLQGLESIGRALEGKKTISPSNAAILRSYLRDARAAIARATGQEVQ